MEGNSGKASHLLCNREERLFRSEPLYMLGAWAVSRYRFAPEQREMTSPFGPRLLLGLPHRLLFVSRRLPHSLACMLLLSVAGLGPFGCGVEIGSAPPTLSVLEGTDLGASS